MYILWSFTIFETRLLDTLSRCDDERMMSLLTFDGLTLAKLLMAEVADMLTKDMEVENRDFQSDTRLHAVGCAFAFVHRINQVYPSEGAILMTPLFEILKIMQEDCRSQDRDQILSVISDAMLSPIPLRVEEVIEVMRCILICLEDSPIDDCRYIIIFSGVLGWVARKALEPTVSTEQRISLAVSTAAVVLKLVEKPCFSGLLFDLLVEQPFLTSLCELWGYEDGIVLRTAHRDLLLHISWITLHLSGLNDSHRVPGLLKAGWAKLVVQVLRAALSRRPLDEDVANQAHHSFMWLLFPNYFTSKVALIRAGAIGTLIEAMLAFPGSEFLKWDCWYSCLKLFFLC